MAYYLKKPHLPNKINGHEVTYQSDRIFYEKQAADNPLSYGAMWAKPSNFGGMWLNLKVLAQNIDDEGFVILQFYGMSNSGKSYLAYAKAWELMWIEIEAGVCDSWVIYNDNGTINRPATSVFIPQHIRLVHNWSQVLAVMASCVVGDIVICDEESTVSGQESVTEANSLRNILRACRVMRVSFFFIDPTPEQKPNTHAWVKCVGKIKDVWTTMSIIEDAHGILVGLDFQLIPMETELVFEEMMLDYEVKKRGNVKTLVDAHGRVGSELALTQQGEALVLFEAAKQREKDSGRKMTLKRLQVLMVDLGMTAGTGPYREQLTTRVMDMLRSGAEGILEPEIDDAGLWWSKESAGEEILPQDFIEQLTPHLYRWAKREGITQDDVDLMLKWFAGASQETLGESAEESQKQMSRKFQEINQKILGYACEDWLAERNPHWKHTGGNTAGIDFESDSAIISVKATSKKHREFTIRDTSKAERDAVIVNGKEFLGWQFHVRHNRIRKIRWTPMEDAPGSKP